MNYLTFFVLGIIIGLVLNVFAREDFSFKPKKSDPANPAATENIEQIKRELAEIKAEIKNYQKENLDLARAENEFFDNGTE